MFILQFASVLKPSHIVIEEDIKPNLEAIAEWEQVHLFQILIS